MGFYSLQLQREMDLGGCDTNSEFTPEPGVADQMYVVIYEFFYILELNFQFQVEIELD